MWAMGRRISETGGKCSKNSIIAKESTTGRRLEIGSWLLSKTRKAKYASADGEGRRVGNGGAGRLVGLDL